MVNRTPNSRGITIELICGVLLAAVSSELLALEPIAKLSPSDAEFGSGEGFGESVSISGDWLVVGAPRDDFVATNAGAAYVYRRAGVYWVEHQKLTGFPLVGDGYGRAVAIDGSRIVIGAPALSFFGGGVGRGYIYERYDTGTPDDTSDDFWRLAALLNPPPSHWCCRFGISVDIDGDVAVVGSLRSSNNVGRAYVFRWDGTEWVFDATLVRADKGGGDSFGASVVVDSGLVLVGAADDDAVEERSGSVFVFRHDGTAWVEEAKLVPSDARERGLFGASLDLDDGVAIVKRALGAYVFRRTKSGWREEEPITPSGPSGGTGKSVAIDGDQIVIAGKAGDDDGFLFRREEAAWIEFEKLVGINEYIGASVAIDGRYAMIARSVFAVGHPVSLGDYAVLQSCFTIGDGAVPPACETFDLEPDGRIGSDDYALFLQAFRGP